MTQIGFWRAHKSHFFSKGKLAIIPGLLGIAVSRLCCLGDSAVARSILAFHGHSKSQEVPPRDANHLNELSNLKYCWPFVCSSLFRGCF